MLKKIIPPVCIVLAFVAYFLQEIILASGGTSGGREMVLSTILTTILGVIAIISSKPHSIMRTTAWVLTAILVVTRVAWWILMLFFYEST